MKYSNTYIDNKKQLLNTIEYIKTNREKHELAINDGLQPIIEKMCCDYDHAFRAEYKGGFDVVIGNPPYVRSRDFNEKVNSYFLKKYNLIISGYDLSTLFIEKLLLLTKNFGISGLITSNKFFSARYGFKLRQHLIKNKFVSKIINLKSGVFQDTPVETSIIIINANKKENFEYINITKEEANIEFVNKKTRTIKFSQLLYTQQLIFFFPNDYIEDVLLRIFEKTKFKIGNFFNFNAGYGITNIKELLKDNKKNNTDIPVYTGKSIWRYYNLEPEYWIEKNLIKQYKASETILIRELSTTNRAIMLQEEVYFSALNSITLITCKNTNYLKSFLLFFNSHIFNKIFKLFFETTRTHSNLRFKEIYITDLPVGNFDKLNHSQAKDISNKMLKLYKQLQEKKTKFLNRVKDNFEIERISKKIDAFYDYDFKTFIAELKKQKIKLSLVQQDEWEEYFYSYKNEINKLQDEINTTDKKIDQMVYNLYELSDKEIKIVEKSVK